MALPDEKYMTADYLKDNPTWDLEDSPWKAKRVSEFLNSQNIPSKHICEVGCGAGGVLAELRTKYKDAVLCGYDISPHASFFWEKNINLNIEFVVGDFLKLNSRNYSLTSHLENSFVVFSRV